MLCASRRRPAPLRPSGAIKDHQFKTEVGAMLPHFAESLHELRTVDWSEESHIGACYSFPAPGAMTKVMPILRQGLGNLYFVGEHCDAAFVGYMEGALASGLRVAEMIAVKKPNMLPQPSSRVA